MSQEENKELKAADINFSGKSLKEWEDEFKLIIPSLPCTSLQINNTLSFLAEKYQSAYNMYTRLLVMCSLAEKEYKALKYNLVNKAMNEYEVKKVARIPPVEKLETIVINKEENSELRDLLNKLQLHELLKDFFENHKQKLEKLIPLLKDIAFTVNQSDRNQHRPSI